MMDRKENYGGCEDANINAKVQYLGKNKNTPK